MKFFMKKIIVANWKMNPLTPAEAGVLAAEIQKVLKGLDKIEVVLCPPALFLETVGKKKVILGAQDSFWQMEGAYTGRISPVMLKEVGVVYVLLGHSDLRATGDTNELVNKKISQALRSGLRVILCVGEAVRDGDGKYFEFVRGQIEECLSKVQKRYLERILIAYEPLWTIGKEAARAAYPADVFEMSIFIRKVLSKIYGKEAKDVPILYGGSVTPKNCADYFKEGGVTGLLVGRQSLRAEEFGKILKAVNEVRG